MQDTCQIVGSDCTYSLLIRAVFCGIKVDTLRRNDIDTLVAGHNGFNIIIHFVGRIPDIRNPLLFAVRRNTGNLISTDSLFTQVIRNFIHCAQIIIQRIIQGRGIGCCGKPKVIVTVLIGRGCHFRGLFVIHLVSCLFHPGAVFFELYQFIGAEAVTFIAVVKAVKSSVLHGKNLQSVCRKILTQGDHPGCNDTILAGNFRHGGGY